MRRSRSGGDVSPVLTGLQVAVLACVLMAIVLILAGCGRKPASVLPPPGAEGIDFPRQYPPPVQPLTPVIAPETAGDAGQAGALHPAAPQDMPPDPMDRYDPQRSPNNGVAAP